MTSSTRSGWESIGTWLASQCADHQRQDQENLIFTFLKACDSICKTGILHQLPLAVWPLSFISGINYSISSPRVVSEKSPLHSSSFRNRADQVQALATGSVDLPKRRITMSRVKRNASVYPSRKTPTASNALGDVGETDRRNWPLNPKASGEPRSAATVVASSSDGVRRVREHAILAELHCWGGTAENRGLQPPT
jgi:hypothetical protein